MRRPVGVAQYGNSPVVVCDDGSVYLWGVNEKTLTPEQLQHYRAGLFTAPHSWIEFHQPIPGTAREAERDGAA